MLLDGAGDPVGHVHWQDSNVVCWGAFGSAEVYRGVVGGGDVQREWQFARIGAALTAWVAVQQASGVELRKFRDAHAYYHEVYRGHEPQTPAEWDFTHPLGIRPGRHDLDQEERLALPVDGWRAVPATTWGCEGYRLRDATGQLRGALQIRYGVIRVVAAQPADGDAADPLVGDGVAARARAQRTCRGQLVVQHRVRPGAGAFRDWERPLWLQRAIAAIAATPDPDRAWPPEIRARGA